MKCPLIRKASVAKKQFMPDRKQYPRNWQENLTVEMQHW